MEFLEKYQPAISNNKSYINIKQVVVAYAHLKIICTGLMRIYSFRLNCFNQFGVFVYIKLVNKMVYNMK